MVVMFPLTLGFLALTMLSLISGFYLFAPWWRLTRRWTDLPAWTIVWWWGWTFLLQGILIADTDRSIEFGQPDPIGIAGIAMIWFGPVMWLAAGVIYRNTLRGRTKTARRH